ncbi:hypothetical protein pb186bvf_017796 [Paramecium bursaria]
MNKLLASLLLIVIATEVVLAYEPPQDSEKQNPNSKKESVSQDQVYPAADYLKIPNENLRAFGIDDKIQQNQNNDHQQKTDNKIQQIRNDDLQQNFDDKIQQDQNIDIFQKIDDKIQQISNGDFESLQDFEDLLNIIEQQYKNYQQSISDGDNQDQSEEINQENQQLSKQIETEILKIRNFIKFNRLKKQKMKQTLALKQQELKDLQNKEYEQQILFQKKDEKWEEIKNKNNQLKTKYNKTLLELKQAEQDFNLIKKQIVDSRLVSQELLSELENQKQDQKVRQIINRTNRYKFQQLRASSGSYAL